ncbi:MAG: MFS transporter [Candidatus Nanohaloarchaea archaeon]
MSRKSVNGLLIYEFLKNSAISLIGVFIPVYILSQGHGLGLAALFIGVSGLTGVLLSLPVSRVIHSKGLRSSLFASYIFLVPGLLLVRSFELSLLVVVTSGLLYGIGNLFHWIGLDAAFAADSDGDRRSMASGKILSLPKVSRILGPLAGGVVFASLGFAVLVSVSVVLLLLSGVPLLWVNRGTGKSYRFGEILSREKRRMVPVFVIRGVQAASSVGVFGMFVFLLVGGALDVGAANALGSLGFVLTGLLAGKADSNGERNLLVSAGGLGAAAMYVARGLVVTPFQAFAVSFISGIFFQVYHVPVYARFADEAEMYGSLAFNTLKRICFSLGTLVTILLLLCSRYFFSLRSSFIAVFLAASVGSLLMVRILS